MERRRIVKRQKKDGRSAGEGQIPPAVRNQLARLFGTSRAEAISTSRSTVSTAPPKTSCSKCCRGCGPQAQPWSWLRTISPSPISPAVTRACSTATWSPSATQIIIREKRVNGGLIIMILVVSERCCICRTTDSKNAHSSPRGKFSVCRNPSTKSLVNFERSTVMQRLMLIHPMV